MKTRNELLSQSVERLRMAKLDTPELDARVLVKYALKLSDAELIGGSDLNVSPDCASGLENMICRRVRGEPVARIIGRKEFWGLSFELGLDTLVPRPETETLIEAALAAFGRGTPRKVLDLGTGTGCLLLGLLSEYPEASGLGVDIAPKAVEVAAANGRRLGFDGRAEFRVSDWDEGVEGQFDLILSNPPYILREDIEKLAPEVRLHDPIKALDGGPDGLSAYRALAAAAARRLAPQGLLIAELGAGQEADVAGVMAKAGLKVDGPARPDLAGIPRALVVRR
ncbi:release factor glutamine methyltransferase [Terrihabitans soli]|uniref:Release factor glutamine methyltransferase n=1 Tax=Terrihabitans soli TaxID=708113 RepID=A0A6S6QHS6_9HYPH|nr:peptide chain release factor N(5)-glutamine methyltransferase [Terrihabitans soli]BCJ89734.1 release factor glutamine methyltransferase [Terrihabitans soli]